MERDDSTASGGQLGSAFIAEFTVTSPEIREFAALVSDVELRFVDYYRDPDEVDHGIFWAITAEFDALEDAFSESPIIVDWLCLVETPIGHLYDIVAEESSDIGATVELSRGSNIVWQVMVAHYGHLFVRAIVPDRDAIIAFRDAIGERGCEFTLERVMTDVGPALPNHALSLTPRQRETILLAYERGFFRQPREVSLEEVGAELGISESAVSGRIIRGLDTLIRECLAADREANERARDI